MNFETSALAVSLQFIDVKDNEKISGGQTTFSHKKYYLKNIFY